jgi:sugar lactone lactonase YvrE
MGWATLALTWAINRWPAGPEGRQTFSMSQKTPQGATEEEGAVIGVLDDEKRARDVREQTGRRRARNMKVEEKEEGEPQDFDCLAAFT